MFELISKLYTTTIVLYSLNRWISTRFRDKFYSQYFTVVALYMSLESSFSFIFYKIPLYNIIKIIFISILSYRGGYAITPDQAGISDKKFLKNNFYQNGNLLPMKIIKLYISMFYFKTENWFETITDEIIPYIIELIKTEQSIFVVMIKIKKKLKVKLIAFLKENENSYDENKTKRLYPVIDRISELNDLPKIKERTKQVEKFIKTDVNNTIMAENNIKEDTFFFQRLFYR